MRGGAVLETLVGVIVLVVAVVFLVFAQGRLDSDPSAGGYELQARFSEIGALTRGAEVRVSGVPVGSVTAIDLDTETYFAQVRLRLRRDVLIPADSTAKITASGLLGGAYVEIEAGGDDDMIAEGGEIVFTQGAVDLFELIGGFVSGGRGGGDS
ncbi:outer membrane lipid asymmetry maintenance protein MlaD [Glycocaulis sp.]|uniref:outer membrane lipid asymmetry maintenance protein MlaD n=1 Tax=Glycocaulis sp. TaxID=1969725 RepID=UPI003F71697F